MNVQRIKDFQNPSDILLYQDSRPDIDAVVSQEVQYQDVYSPTMQYKRYFHQHNDIIGNFRFSFGRKVDVESITIEDGNTEEYYDKIIWDGSYFTVEELTKLLPFSLRNSGLVMTINLVSDIQCTLKCIFTSIRFSYLFYHYMRASRVFLIDGKRYIYGNPKECSLITPDITIDSVLDTDRIRISQLYLPSNKALTYFIRHDGDNSLMRRVCNFLFVYVDIIVDPARVVSFLSDRDDLGKDLELYKKRY